ncbi:hypothetical protein QQ045_003984 [Rhodiola kirilowii]
MLGKDAPNNTNKTQGHTITTAARSKVKGKEARSKKNKLLLAGAAPPRFTQNMSFAVE